jgi:hypothetical protein
VVFLDPSNQIKKDEMDGHVGRMGKLRNAYGILVGKPEVSRPLEQP